MNPNHAEQPNLNLPAPIFEATIPLDQKSPAAARPEQQMSSLQQPPSTSSSPISLPATGMPAQDLSLAVTPQIPLSGGSSTPLIADDGDLIEKEWVEKAKAIVASTRDDPYVQTNEVNRFKADYMKRRYNKDIKLTKN